MEEAWLHEACIDETTMLSPASNRESASDPPVRRRLDVLLAMTGAVATIADKTKLMAGRSCLAAMAFVSTAAI